MPRRLLDPRALVHGVTKCRHLEPAAPRVDTNRVSGHLYRLCYLRGPAGIIVALAEQIG